MKRIAIVGSGGAGKSTLARQLGAILHIDVLHLDTYFWKPGWVEPSHADWRKQMETFVGGESWIMDGTYGGTLDLRFEAADTIIFLDYSRFICLWRALKRRVQYHKRSRPDQAPGCPEQLSWTFLKWVWAYPEMRRPSVMQRMRSCGADKQVYIFRSPRDVQRFLRVLAHQHVQKPELEAPLVS